MEKIIKPEMSCYMVANFTPWNVMRNTHKKLHLFYFSLCLIIFVITGCSDINNSSFLSSEEVFFSDESSAAQTTESFEIWNQNIPGFTADEITTQSFESYSELDELGRCGVAFACIGEDIMPTEERGKIGQIKPSGWHTVKYDCVDGKYLYNRCHLIAYQLAGENANEKNLITGTRYMNVAGMLPFENEVADYVKETGNHVMYRVTPVFEGENLLADGVEMEAYSVEDAGEGVSYHVFVYNKQPGIIIDYATGESERNSEEAEKVTNDIESDIKEDNEDGDLFLYTEEDLKKTDCDYILNTNTMRFHFPSCDSVGQMKEHNKEYYSGTREQLIENGYVPCGNCKP